MIRKHLDFLEEIQVKGGATGRTDTVNFNLFYLRRGEEILPSKVFEEVKNVKNKKEPTLQK